MSRYQNSLSLPRPCWYSGSYDNHAAIHPGTTPWRAPATVDPAPSAAAAKRTSGIGNSFGTGKLIAKFTEIEAGNQQHSAALPAFGKGSLKLRQIAEGLNALNIRPARGRQWYASSVRNQLAENWGNG